MLLRNIVSAILVFAACLKPALAASLTAETSRPNMSTFAVGEKVTLTFTVAGLPPSSETSLHVVIKDEHDSAISSTSIPVTASADGSWTGQYAAQCARLGFYLVYPTLEDGTTLPKIVTRQANT